MEGSGSDESRGDESTRDEDDEEEEDEGNGVDNDEDDISEIENEDEDVILAVISGPLGRWNKMSHQNLFWEEHNQKLRN